jgi:predicted nuclease of predicted toxin-antitoxin system
VKILLDEMMPNRFAPLLVGHEVAHVVELGWRGVTDSKLLARCVADGFTVFITKDGNLPYQQNLTGRQLAILVLKPATQDLLDLLALAPEVLQLLPSREPGSVTRVTLL